jgi:hypothetical protein
MSVLGISNSFLGLACARVGGARTVAHADAGTHTLSAHALQSTHLLQQPAVPQAQPRRLTRGVPKLQSKPRPELTQALPAVEQFLEIPLSTFVRRHSAFVWLWYRHARIVLLCAGFGIRRSPWARSEFPTSGRHP